MDSVLQEESFGKSLYEKIIWWHELRKQYVTSDDALYYIFIRFLQLGCF